MCCFYIFLTILLLIHFQNVCDFSIKLHLQSKTPQHSNCHHGLLVSRPDIVFVPISRIWVAQPEDDIKHSISYLSSAIYIICPEFLRPSLYWVTQDAVEIYAGFVDLSDCCGSFIPTVVTEYWQTSKEYMLTY